MRVKIRILYSLVLFISFTNYSLAEHSIKDYENMSILEYLKLPDEKLNVEIASLIMSKEVYPKIKFKAYIKKIDGIVKKVIELTGCRIEPEYRIASINTVLFKDLDYAYDKKDFYGKKTKNHFLVGILNTKTGVCDSIPLLYLIICERLNYPVYLSRAPNHFYLIYYDPLIPYITNIEATGEGGFNPNAHYIHDFKIPQKTIKNGVYMKPLSKREAIASYLLNNVVYHYNKKNYYRAIEYAEEIVKNTKTFSEAYFFLYLAYEKLAYNFAYNTDIKLNSNKDNFFKLSKKYSSGEKNTLNYGSFPRNNLNSSTIRPKVNRPSPLPSTVGPPVVRNNLTGENNINLLNELEKERNEHIKEIYLSQAEINLNKVEELGMGPPLERDYWKKYFTGISIKEGDLNSDGSIKKVKYYLNGVEFEIDSTLYNRIMEANKKNEKNKK